MTLSGSAIRLSENHTERDHKTPGPMQRLEPTFSQPFTKDPGTLVPRRSVSMTRSPPPGPERTYAELLALTYRVTVLLVELLDPPTGLDESTTELTHFSLKSRNQPFDNRPLTFEPVLPPPG